MSPVVTAQVVEHDIESDPGRKTVCGGWTQEGGTEIIPGEQGDIALRPDLGDAVGRDGVERACFLHELIAGQTVIAARRGKQKTLDLGSLGESRQTQAGAVIDAISDLRSEIAERIV